MLVTEFGILRVPVRPLQPLKAYADMLVTFAPMFSVVRFVQPWKTVYKLLSGSIKTPIVQLVALKLTVVRLLQSRKAQ